MKLGRGWTQSPPGIAYHEITVLIPLSTEEVRFTEQPVFNHNFWFVSVWLVVVDVFIQNVLSELTCLRLVDKGVFRDLRAFSAPVSRRATRC